MRLTAPCSGDEAPGESVRRLGEQQRGGAEDLRALAERALGHAHGGDRRRDRAALDRDAQRLEQDGGGARPRAAGATARRWMGPRGGARRPAPAPASSPPITTSSGLSTLTTAATALPTAAPASAAARPAPPSPARPS